MTEIIHGTRSVDSTSLKKHVAQYLPIDPHKEGIKPPIVNGSKAEMGLKHPVLARFLCPVDRVQDYDADMAG